jgi:hypothetical protein
VRQHYTPPKEETWQPIARVVFVIGMTVWFAWSIVENLAK